MAGEATVSIKVKVTGIGDDISVYNSKVTTVPVEALSGYTLVTTATTTALQFFSDITKIALAKIYGVYIKAEVGTIYIMINTAGTTTFTGATADLVLATGESCYLPINPLSNLGMTIDAVAITDAFSWIILAKA